MTIDLATVAKIATLSRLKIPEAEQAQVAGELNGILKWIAQLDEVDVTNVAPMTAVNDIALPQREDIVTDGDCANDILANAPSKTAGFFIVPKVVE